MIYRDRNHPSVILWSIGNEINERADSLGFAIRKQLVKEVHALDTTRPVTEAICAVLGSLGTEMVNNCSGIFRFGCWQGITI